VKDEFVINGNLSAAECGLIVVDIGEHPDFVNRPLRERNMSAQTEEMQRLVNLFVSEPAEILHRLTDAALDLCGADSAGISVETPEGGEDAFWFWAAISGEYQRFQNSALPRYPSVCGLTLDRGGPQHFVVTQRFFDLAGFQAPLVTDGLMLPWNAGGKRGTIWLMAHGRSQAFDVNDLMVAGTLADFAAMATRQSETQKEETPSNATMKSWMQAVKDPLEISMKQIFLTAKKRSNADDN
jgi:hypothetical protein